jgi:hypothetical protein
VSTVLSIYKLGCLNKENNNRYLITAEALFTFAIMVTASNMATTIPTAATTTSNTTAMTNNNTTPLSSLSSSGLKFSAQPV